MFDQREFDIRCEWGAEGVSHLAPISDAVVIVDVLSFSTCVDIAVSRGAVVYPYHLRDDSAAYAQQVQAILARTDRQANDGYSLSPASLLGIPAGTRLVLPSPNGATLSLLAGDTATFAGCLRNASAVAQAAQRQGRYISVIPAGERWKTNGTLRPALEDLVGAGAVIHYLRGAKSPEAEIAEIAFLHFKESLLTCLRQIGSGKELIAAGFEQDVELVALLNQSDSAPRLKDRGYVSE